MYCRFTRPEYTKNQANPHYDLHFYLLALLVYFLNHPAAVLSRSMYVIFTEF